METNYKGLQVIHNFLWSGDNEKGQALTERHCNPTQCKYSKDYILLCYRELLEKIIVESLHYDSPEKCIFNCSS